MVGRRVDTVWVVGIVWACGWVGGGLVVGCGLRERRGEGGLKVLGLVGGVDWDK